MDKEQKLTPEQKWEQATLANNFIFYKVMRHHPDACKKLLEMLLNIQIEQMEMVSEETIDLDHDSKGIRLDVFVKETGRVHDIELQTTNTKELPERSRYYQGLMDLDTLKSGHTYKELKNSHVIFICMEDIFNKGLPVYTFENVCREDGSTKLNDRAYRHFFIAPICATMLEDEGLKAFFKFLILNKVETDYTSALNAYVVDAKHNMQWRMQYMTFERMQAYAFEDGLEQGREEGLEKGREEGLEKGREEKCVAARALLADGKYTAEEISALLGIPVESFATVPAPANQ